MGKEVKKRLKEKDKKLGLKYYRKKDYKKALSYFEQALRKDKEDPQIYRFLGYCSLFIGDFDGARRYFKGGLLVDEDNIELMKGLAFVYLKDERIEDAIGLWGEVLQKNKRDRMVKNALKGLRESEEPLIFIENVKPQELMNMRPPLSTKIKPFITAGIITLAVFIIGVLIYFTPVYNKILRTFYPDYFELKSITLPREEAMTSPGLGDALFTFSDQEIEKYFVRIKKDIYRGRYNSAIILMNKVMQSNAHPLVKERFGILYDFLEPPDPLSLDINPGLSEVLKQPVVYKGIYVLWKGRIANLKKSKEGASFDLLVNYINEDTVEGIAHVDAVGTYYLQSKQMVEVYANFTGRVEPGGRVILKALLIRDLGG